MDEKKQGWLNLYKPVGISSFSAIYKIKKKFNIKKIGHAGTLDPNAEGVLPIAINKTTKLIPFICWMYPWSPIATPWANSEIWINIKNKRFFILFYK